MATKNTITLSFPEDLAENYQDIRYDEATSDVVLVVGQKKYRAHTQVLSDQSKFFKTLFIHKNFAAETSSEIPLTVSQEAFDILFEYFYSGNIVLDRDNLQKTLEFYEVVHWYDMDKLEMRLQHYLVDQLTVENIFMFIDFTKNFCLTTMMEQCFKFLDQNMLNIESVYFSTITQELCKEILSRPTLRFTSLQKFQIMCGWMLSHPEVTNFEDFLPLIDLTRLTNDQIIHYVGPTGLYSYQFLMEFMFSRGDVQEEYIPTPNSEPAIIPVQRHESQSYIKLRPETGNIERGRWFNNEVCNRTLYLLRQPFDFNTVNVKCGTAKTYKFKIEASKNAEKWITIYDEKRFQRCRDIDFYVEAKNIRYVRISGIYEVAKITLTNDPKVKFVDKIPIAPYKINCNNFASSSHDISGSVTKNEISCGDITVTLSQAFHISYLRFRGWIVEKHPANRDISIRFEGPSHLVDTKIIKLRQHKLHYVPLEMQPVQKIIFHGIEKHIGIFDLHAA